MTTLIIAAAVAALALLAFALAAGDAHYTAAATPRPTYRELTTPNATTGNRCTPSTREDTNPR